MKKFMYRYHTKEYMFRYQMKEYMYCYKMTEEMYRYQMKENMYTSAMLYLNWVGTGQNKVNAFHAFFHTRSDFFRSVINCDFLIIINF